MSFYIDLGFVQQSRCLRKNLWKHALVDGAILANPDSGPILFCSSNQGAHWIRRRLQNLRCMSRWRPIS